MNNRKSFIRLFLSLSLGWGAMSLNAQTVNKTFTNEPLKTVLKELESQTGYSVIYRTDEVDVHRKVSASFDNASLNEVMSKILDSQLTWTVQDKMIIISRKTQEKKQKEEKTITIKGVISDESGFPVIGASVLVRGSADGSITDVNGNYTISNVPSDAMIDISYIGYKTLSFKATDKALSNIVLKEDTEVLDEVVVVAYGTQSKVSVTGSVSSIKTDEIKKAPAPNMISALTGRLSGLTTIQSSGMPGEENFSMYLRGASTTNSQNPLILVDGVPRDNISMIDPNEVESVSVLKDASSTAVFGVRGANGVILITTKQGSEEKPSLNITAEFGRQAPTREIHQVDSWDFAILKNQAMVNDGFPANSAYSERQIQLFRDGTNPLYPNTDWWNIAMKSYAPQNRYNVNLSGGTDKVKYFVNLGMLNQGGLFKTESKDKLGYDPSFKLNRYNFRTNLNVKVANWINVGLNLAGYIDKQNKGGCMGDNPFEASRTNIAYIYNHIYETPSVIPGPVTTVEMAKLYGIQSGVPIVAAFESQGASPYSDINYRGFSSLDKSNLNSSLFFDFDLGWITKGLTSKVMVSFDTKGTSLIDAARGVYAYCFSVYQAEKDGNIIDIPIFSPNTSPDFQRLNIAKQSQFQYTMNMQWILNYTHLFADKHHLSGMFLMQRDNSEAVAGSSDKLLPYNVVGFSGRLGYRYNDKYMLEFNAGYNGSEQFAPGKRFGFFPAASVGWVVSNEPFMKSLPSISNLKLRASYGKVGNDKLGDMRFLYLDNIQIDNGGFSPSLGNGQLVNQTLVANPNLTWEVSYKQNYGIDLSLFSNSLRFTADYYFEHRKNILITQNSMPTMIGWPLNVVPKANLGKIDNKGFELELSYDKRINKDWTFFVKGTFNYNKNNVVDLDEVPFIDEERPYESPYRIEGYSLGQPFGLLIDWNSPGKGYFTSYEEIENSGLIYEGRAPRPGDFKYKDLNGDKVIDSRDEVAIGYGSIPRITYSAMINLGYKGFDVSCMFQGVAKTSQYYTGLGVIECGGRDVTFFDIHLNSWTEERYNNNLPISYPALSIQASASHRPNDFFIMDRSYLRLKNIELGYTFPNSLISKIKLKNFRVYLNAQNLFTWDKLPFKHFDPEQINATVMPINKIVNLGINLAF